MEDDRAPDHVAAASFMRVVAAVEAAVAAGDHPDAEAELLRALHALRDLRASLDDWEPELIAAARARGVSWARLAPALGVASRQAAERRYLRSRTPDPDEAGSNRDERVLAVRDRRAGDRAVTGWARGQGADLRQLAGQVSALTDLDPAAKPGLDRLLAGLADNDAATLLPLLADIHRHLGARHASLAERVDTVARQAQEVRNDSQRRRIRRRGGDSPAGEPKA